MIQKIADEIYEIEKTEKVLDFCSMTFDKDLVEDQLPLI